MKYSQTKKILALFLTVISLFTVCISGISANAAISTPTIYVSGQGARVYSADEKVLYDGVHVPVPDGLIEEAMNECLPLLVPALATGNYSEYLSKLLPYIDTIYGEVMLDKDGEASNGAHISFNGDYTTINPDFLFGSYNLSIDWRADPFKTAEILNSFIEYLKEKHNCSKVNLIGRCEGACVVLSYLAEYGYDSVNCIELYVSSVNGVDAVGAVFSGDVSLSTEELEKFYNEELTIDNPELKEALDMIIPYLKNTLSFEAFRALLEKAWPVFHKKAFCEIILHSYATMPGVWTMVGPDYYKDARKTIFAGRETEYSVLLEKLDRYDRLVRSCSCDLLKEAADHGVKIGIFAKYNDKSDTAPISKEAEYPGDNACSITGATFGATTSKSNETLSAKYLKGKDPAYISPDRRIDTSTCLFPETTWITYNTQHKDFNSDTDVLMRKFLESDGTMTVNTDPEYPRFTVMRDGRMVPMTEEDYTPEKSAGIFARFKTYIQSIFKLWKNIFALLKKLTAK